MRHQGAADILDKYGERLGRTVLFAGATLCAGAVALATTRFRGDWVAQRFLIVYMAPLFLFGAAWAREQFRTASDTPPVILLLRAVVFATGGLRIGGGWGVLPYSGHMLFLTFVILASGERRFRWLALVLAAMTTWFKLILWHDWRTWALGVGAGFAFAFMQRMLLRRTLVAHAG